MKLLASVLLRPAQSPEEKRDQVIRKETNTKLLNSFLNGFNNQGPELNIGQYDARQQQLLKNRLYNLKDQIDSYIANTNGMAVLFKIFVDNIGLLREKSYKPNMSKRDFLKLLATYNLTTALVQRQLSALPDEKLQLTKSLFEHERMFERFILEERRQSLNLSTDDKELLRIRFDEFYDRYLESQKTGTARALRTSIESTLCASGIDMVQRAKSAARSGA